MAKKKAADKKEIAEKKAEVTKINSYFDGGLLGLIGINIAMVFLTIITLFIGYPFALCMKQKWYAKHTVLEGRRLTFTGKGGQLWGKFIVWFLLCIITLGIYSLWLSIKMKQWVVSHTEFEKAA